MIATQCLSSFKGFVEIMNTEQYVHCNSLWITAKQILQMRIVSVLIYSSSFTGEAGECTYPERPLGVIFHPFIIRPCTHLFTATFKSVIYSANLQQNCRELLQVCIIIHKMYIICMYISCKICLNINLKRCEFIAGLFLICKICSELSVSMYGIGHGVSAG